MTTKLDRFFNGEQWNREAVVVAQRLRAIANAQHHGWDLPDRSLLSDPLAPDLVEKFENVYNIILPAEYRSFLLQVGDGGDGPGLYMRSLGAPFDDSLPWEDGEIYQGPNDPNSYLGESFSHTDVFSIEPRDADQYTTAGALYLFDQGDAMWDLLVVNGTCAGQIWLDRLTDSKGLSPATDVFGERIGFAKYYCNWLSGS